MKHLTDDISSDPICPFCELPVDGPGQPYGEDILHSACYDRLGHELGMGPLAASTRCLAHATPFIRSIILTMSRFFVAYCFRCRQGSSCLLL